MRTFEFRDDKSAKFWSIDLQGKRFTVCFGKIGTTGQTQVKDFADAAKALKEHDKLIAEKVGKGYRETKSGPAPTPAPASCLQYLSLVGTYVNDEGVKALAAWSGLARIIYLHVGHGHDNDPLTVASIHAIADSPYAANLECQHIEGHNFYAPGDTLESAQAKQIIALSKLGALKKLEFCNFYDNLWDSETSELNAERAALVPTWRGTTWEDFGQN
jgi:predicted DNA-binding WGR domain protein